MNSMPSVGIYQIHNVLIKVKGLNGASIRTLMSQISKLPRNLFIYTQTIYIYDSPEDTEFNSSYLEGTIKINLSTVNDKNNLIKLIAHELFHSFEPKLKEEDSEWFGVYQSVVREYKRKKNKLLNKLSSDPNVLNKPHPKFWTTIEFNNEFDSYLYHDVTYAALQFRIADLFPSPYSITSISEYMCVGVEIYLFENTNWLRVHCPELYRLIMKVIWKKSES